MATAGYKAQVNVSGDPVAFTEETTTANDSLTEFQITDASKRVWDRKGAVTVEQSTNGGTSWNEVDPTALVVNRLTGTVIFQTARDEGTSVRVSGSYLPMSKAAEAYEYEYTIEADNIDRMAFGSAYQQRSQGLLDISGSVERWYPSGSLFSDAVRNRQVMVVELYSDSSKTDPDVKAWSLISSNEASAETSGLVEESVEFEGTTDQDGRMIALG